MPPPSTQPSSQCEDAKAADSVARDLDHAARQTGSGRSDNTWLDRVQRLTGMRVHLPLHTSEPIGDGGRWMHASVKPGWYILHVDTHSCNMASQAIGLTLNLSIGVASFQLLLTSTPATRRVIYLDEASCRLEVRLEEGVDPAHAVKITLSRVTQRYAERRMLKRMTRRFDPTLYKESISNVERLRTDMLRSKGHWPTSSDLFELYHQALQRNFTPIPYSAWLRDHARALREHWNKVSKGHAIPDLSIRILLQSPDDHSQWQKLVDTCQTAGKVRFTVSALDHIQAVVSTAKARQGAAALTSTRSGEFIILSGAGVMPSSEYLTALVQTLAVQPERHLLYTDSDNSGHNGEPQHPVVKPGWDPYLLASGNYIGQLFVCSQALYQQCGSPDTTLGESALYDFLLRASTMLTRGDVSHIPGILYTQASRRNARLEDRWFFKGDHDADARRNHEQSWSLPEKVPSVEIIIPSRNQAPVLRRCIESIFTHTHYPDYHITVVDNGSTDADVIQFYQTLADDDRLDVMNSPGPFNYSALNNSAVAGSRSDILVLLNNDTEIMQSNWLYRMVSACHQPQIGCVGAKLLYANGRVQHAGVVMGMKGVAGHAHRFCLPEAPSYMHKLQHAHQVSAVTAACLAVRRDLYEQMNGLDEKCLTVAFNDVDFCLRVHSAGYDNLMLPDVSILHHESLSRGKDDSPEKAARFAAECKTMRERWQAIMHRDPYWNPLLSLVDEQPMLEAALPPVA